MGNDIIETAKRERGELDNMALTFRVGESTYGLPLANVLEIINVQPVTPIMSSAPHIRGIIDLRGVIVPVVDARIKFGLGEREYDEQCSFIITQVGDARVGLAVDRVINVATLDEAGTQPLPEFATVNSNRHIKNVSRIDGNLVMILNAETVLDVDDWNAAELGDIVEEKDG